MTASAFALCQTCGNAVAWWHAGYQLSRCTVAGTHPPCVLERQAAVCLLKGLQPLPQHCVHTGQPGAIVPAVRIHGTEAHHRSCAWPTHICTHTLKPDLGAAPKSYVFHCNLLSVTDTHMPSGCIWLTGLVIHCNDGKPSDVPMRPHKSHWPYCPALGDSVYGCLSAS